MNRVGRHTTLLQEPSSESSGQMWLDFRFEISTIFLRQCVMAGWYIIRF